MKNNNLKIAITIVLFFICQLNYAQRRNAFTPVKNYTYNVYADSIIDSLYLIEHLTYSSNTPPKNLLVSNRGLNKYFANKIGYFLTGEDKSSLNKNYIFLNAGDNELVFGHNRFFERENHRIQSVINFGIRANLEDNFAEIKNSDGFTNNIGLNIKWTWFGNGKIFYDNNYSQETFKNLRIDQIELGKQKCDLTNKRIELLNTLSLQIKKEADEFEESLNNLRIDSTRFCGNFLVFEQEKKVEFYNELKDKYFDLFSTTEADYLEKYDVKNFVKVGWLSISGFAPFTRESYFLIDSLKMLPYEKKSYLAEFKISYSYLLEHVNWGKLFLILLFAILFEFKFYNFFRIFLAS